MAKPRFQALVDLHAARESDARKALGKLEIERAAIVDRIAAVVSARERAARDCDPRLRQVYDAWSIRIEGEVDGLRRMQRQVEERSEQVRQQLIVAHRDHRVFQRLRDRSLAERDAERERRQARAFDDFAAARGHTERNAQEGS